MSDDIDTREPVNVELELRREWWLHHGHDYALYGDDGEMQCSTCPADFKRMPLDVLQRYVFDARMKRASLAAAGVSDSPDEERELLSLRSELTTLLGPIIPRAGVTANDQWIAKVAQVLAERDEAREVAKTLRAAFPDGSWQHSRESADAADGFDEMWARYRRARDGTNRPSVPRTMQSRSAS